MANFAIFGSNGIIWENNNSWTINTTGRVEESDILSVNITNQSAVVRSSPISVDNLMGQAYFLTFDVSGEMRLFSKLVLELLLANGKEVSWEVKRLSNATTNQTNASVKYRIKKNWFNGISQSFRIRITFYQSPASDSFLSISNLRIANNNNARSNADNINIGNADLGLMLLAARTTNGTGTSGPNGPR